MKMMGRILLVEIVLPTFKIVSNVLIRHIELMFVNYYVFNATIAKVKI